MRKSKPNNAKFIIAVCIIFLSACWKYKKIIEVYPHHFVEGETRERQELLPADIYNSLPGDYKLAQQIGLMSVDVFDDCDIAYREKNETYSKRKFIESKKLKLRIAQLKQNNFNVYVPIQFPHVICYYAKGVDLIKTFEEEAVMDIWIKLDEVATNDSIINAQIRENLILRDTLKSTEEFLKDLDKHLQRKKQEEKYWIDLNNKLDQDIASINSQITSVRFISTQKTLFANFDSKNLKVFTKNDPFEETHKATQVQISDKPYNTPNNTKNGYDRVNAKMANALDKFNSDLQNPREAFGKDKSFSEEDIKTMEEWAADPKNKLSITSAARNPQHQIDLSNDKKAGPISSKHALGVAVDINVNGRAYDPSKSKANYDLFRKAASKSGLFFPLPGDKVEKGHAVLEEYQGKGVPNAEPYCKELAELLEGYNKGIEKELDHQDKTKGEKSKEKDEFEKNLKAIKEQVSKKLNEVNEINKKIDALKQTHRGKADELQRKTNELCSKLAAKKKTHERDPNRSLGHRDHNSKSGSRSGGAKKSEGWGERRLP